MRSLTAVLPLLTLAATSVPAFASVEYSFYAPAFEEFRTNIEGPGIPFAFESFDFKVSDFITKSTSLTGKEAGCSFFLGSCTSVDFNPASSSSGKDTLTINYSLFLGEDLKANVVALDDPPPLTGSDTYTFDAGTFGKSGSYLSTDLVPGALDVSGTGMSPVPLPGAAPMFGAALLALGVWGYGLKRKDKAAA